MFLDGLGEHNCVSREAKQEVSLLFLEQMSLGEMLRQKQLKSTQELVSLTLADTDFSQEPSGFQQLPESGSVLRLARCLQLEAWCTLI